MSAHMNIRLEGDALYVRLRFAGRFYLECDKCGWTTDFPHETTGLLVGTAAAHTVLHGSTCPRDRV